MTYNITRTNGSHFMDIEENTTDTIVYKDGNQGGGIVMIGKLVAEYGTDQSNNFLRLLENFANENEPDNPIVGMLWYKTSEKSLFICTSEEGEIQWTKLLYIRTSQADDAQRGDIYYDDVNQEFYVYDDVKKWVLVGPFNYNHRIQRHWEGKTSAGSDTATGLFDIPSNLLDDCSYLVTVKVVAREKYDVLNTTIIDPDKKPSSAAWITTMLMERYKNPSTLSEETIIVGNPNVQTIAKIGDITESWGYEVTVSESGSLAIGVRGPNGLVNVPESENHIAWEVELELLKV